MSTGVVVKTTLRQRVATEIKVLLVRHNMTAVELAERIGMGQRSMSRRMTAAVPFDVDDLELIAPVFDTTPAEIMARASGEATRRYPSAPNRPIDNRPSGRAAPHAAQATSRRAARVPRTGPPRLG